MLLPVDADLIALGLTAAAFLGTVAYLVRGGRLLWVLIACGSVTLAFAGLSVVTIKYSSQVIRVSGDGEPHASRSMLVGGTTIELGGRDVELSGDGTIIVNETSRRLVVRAAVYSELATGPAAPADISVAPLTAANVPAHIDHIGPQDPLPAQVSSNTTSTTKYWLTW